MKLKAPKARFENVLLIDDNELDNFINQKILESNYFAKHIFVNTSAKSALEFLNNLVVMGEKGMHNHPQVIFIDINMPLMDGFQFIDHFKKNLESKLNKTKLVILTSSLNNEDKLKTRAISKDILFLNKPLKGEMLMDQEAFHLV